MLELVRLNNEKLARQLAHVLGREGIRTREEAGDGRSRSLDSLWFDFLNRVFSPRKSDQLANRDTRFQSSIVL